MFYDHQTYCFIFTGSSSSMKGISTAKTPGVAELCGISRVTIPSIAYAAVLARHLITADTSFKKDKNFSYLDFYSNVIDAFESQLKAWRDETLDWWNA